MAHLNYSLTIIMICILIVIVLLIHKLEKTRKESLNLIEDIVHEIKVIKKDFKHTKIFNNKY